MEHDGNRVILSDINVYFINTSKTYKTIYRNGLKYIKTIRKNVKKDLFNGIYIGLPLKKKNTSKIYLIPNNLNSIMSSKITKRITYSGASIMLEDPYISHKYKVFCDNEIKARKILSFSFMEKINKLDNIFDDEKYIVFKEDNRFSICINEISIEAMKNNLLPLFRDFSKEQSILTDTFEKIIKLLTIYDIFN